MEVIDLNEEVTEEVVPNEEVEEVVEKKVKKKKKNPLIKIKEWFEELSKKNKIIFCVCLSLLLIAIIVLIVALTGDKEDEKAVEEEEIVILSMGNYKYIDGTLFFYDEEDTELGSYVCEVKDESKCSLAISSIDTTLDLVVSIYEDETSVDYYMPIYENHVFIRDNDAIYLYNIDTNEVDEEYLNVYKAYSTYAITEDESGNFYLLDLAKGYDIISDGNYDYIGSNQLNDYFSYSDNGSYGIMDNTGEVIVSKVDGTITNYNDDVIVVKGSTNSLINYKNETKVSSFDEVKLYDDYVFVIIDGFIYTYDLVFNKINEVGVPIDVDSYTDYDIYNEGGKITDSIRAISYTNSNEKTLVINKVSFNTYEAVVNSNYDYISYLDGTIYTYSDKNKNNITGTYDCNVKNNITTTSDTYTSCYIASHSSLMDSSIKTTGVLPIVHSKYIFVYDTQTLSLHDNIVLYDIQKEEELASYTNIEVLSSSTYEKNVTNYSSGDFVIYASNSDGLYGITSLSKTSASIIIDFKYESISTLDGYYVAVDENGYRFLFTSSGSMISSSSSKLEHDIIGYSNGYIIASVSGAYQLYNASGTSVSDVYDQIFMSTTRYAVIGNKSVDVYSYTDQSSVLYTTEVDYNFDYLTIDEDNNTITTYDTSGNVIETHELG
ncbi:MAG: hypothetical protein R3Y13_04315 [bacterium]